jgi:hypothetical protein
MIRTQTMASRSALALSLAIMSLPVLGDEIILHLASRHVDQAAERNETNTGIGLRIGYTNRIDLIAGTYRNSFDSTSIYAGAGYTFARSQHVSLGILAGAITGYNESLAPMLMPELSFSAGAASMKINYIPAVHYRGLNASGAYVFSIGWRYS